MSLSSLTRFRQRSGVHGGGLLDLIILFCAIVALCLASAYSRLLWLTPLKNHDTSRQVAWFVFYAGTAPVLTIAFTITSLALYVRGVLQPFHVLLTSFLLNTAWAIQLAFWMRCNMIFGGSNSGNNLHDSVCYQDYVDRNSENWNTLTPMGMGMIVLAILLLHSLSCLIYVAFGAEGVHRLRTKQRRERERGNRGQGRQ